MPIKTKIKINKFVSAYAKINKFDSAAFAAKIIFLGLIFSTIPFLVQATTADFNVDPAYDFSNRSSVSSFLYSIGNNAYFYVEDGFYQSLNDEQKKEFAGSVQNLSQEFDNVIYPQVTSVFGSEWKPGIDGDLKITVLLTRIKKENAGYFNERDEYKKTEVPTSNEREMIYLNADSINTPLIKSYLAHEFLHLITFNQKNKKLNLEEDTWLNEARADIIPTFLGYDKIYEGSNLQRRAKVFFQSPNEPLTEWQNNSIDYSAANLFSQYIIDHYGMKILSDSLKSSKIGIASLNEALKNNGFNDDFSQIFTNWLMTLFVNDCSLGNKYCYLNSNLKELRVVPQMNYLPLVGETTLSATYYSKNWTGNWLKFIGGKGTLKLEFSGDSNVKFRVLYLIQDNSGKYVLKTLELNSAQQAAALIPDFGSNYSSLIVIPSVQNKFSNFEIIEIYYRFVLTASITDQNQSGENDLTKQLLSQIALLQQEIARLQFQIANIIAQNGNGNSQPNCQKFKNNLYYGLTNNSEIRCLQEFLKNQGAGIYPEGLISGNFLSLTQAAVIRFQEKYASEILAPLGLQKGTGFVGVSTRAKMKQLLGK